MRNRTRRTAKVTAPVVVTTPATRAERIESALEGLFDKMVVADRQATIHEANLAEYVVQHGALRATSEMEYAIKYRAQANAFEMLRERIGVAFDRRDAWRARLIEIANTGSCAGEESFRYYSASLRDELNAIVMTTPIEEQDARTLLLGLRHFRDSVTEQAIREMSSPTQLRAASIRDAAEVAQRAASASVLRDDLQWPLMRLADLFGVALD
jgi:hypothetical protein